MGEGSTRTARELLEELFRAAVVAADPREATLAALRRSPPSLPARVHVVAIGKAAEAMAASALAWLAEQGRAPSGGLVVGVNDAMRPPQERGDAPSARLVRLAGDHPVPGSRSRAAADALATVAARVHADDLVLVLLSGGTSALVGAPIAGVAPDELARCTARLLGSGAPIGVVNAVRKRFARWGAGRLAVALAPAAVHCLAVSDVAGDDPADIGSGPCVPDPLSATELLRLLHQRALTELLPPSCRAHLDAVRAGVAPETPKPDDPAFARVSVDVILDNAAARRGVLRRARELGVDAEERLPELEGEARVAGERVATEALQCARRQSLSRHRLLVWGGETTVTLPPDAPAGGRCQELALAAALALHQARLRTAWVPVTLLAAGTDGRDGPTDAAGAVVDADVVDALQRTGIDARRALADHDAHRALDRVGALLRTGATGTNVRDVVLALLEPMPSAGTPLAGSGLVHF